MSKIKDLYAEVNDIDDLKPTYNREFFDHVQKSDEERMRKQLLERAGKFVGLDDWLYERADWRVDYDEEGHMSWDIDNFDHLADTAATDLVDFYIEDQHFDMSDELYTKTIDWLGDQLIEMWQEKKQSLIERKIEDDKEEWAQHTSFYNKDNLGV